MHGDVINALVSRPALEPLWEVATSGLMTPRELIKLYDCAREASGPGVLVEVGSWAGTSALTILAGQHDAPGVKSILYCIDNFEKDTEREFERNLSAALAAGDVVPLVGRSVDVAARWPKGREIKLLFLDGDHRYATVRRELNLFTPRLLPDATVLFHDCFYRPEPCRPFQVYFANLGVSRAIRDRVLRDPRFGWFEHEYSLFVARFNPDASALAYPDDERERFIEYFDAHTGLHSASLKAAYSVYLLARAAKEVSDRIRITRAIRWAMTALGVLRFFGRPV